MEGQRREGAEDKEEYVLDADRLLGETAKVGGFGGGGCWSGLLNARPG